MPAAQEKPTGLVTTSPQPALAASILPAKDDPSLAIQPATLAEYEHTWRLNGPEWKGFLSLESYLDRELYLGEAEMTKDGRATAWVLTSSNLPPNPDGSRPILASCETILKNAFVAKGGELMRVLSHGIGSVHCRPEYRGRGYAVQMLKALGDKLNTWQQTKNSKGKFSVLYSDIGPKYYAKLGWKAFPSTHISLKPINPMHYERLYSQHQLPAVDDLWTTEIEKLPLVSQLEERISTLSKSDHAKSFVAFSPDMDIFNWHFKREEFLAEILGREQPEVKGAIDGKTGIALIWSRTYSTDSSEWHLSILYTFVPKEATSTDENRKALAALMLRAQREADIWDLEAGVEVWDPSDEVVAAAKMIASVPNDVSVVERDQEHICSLKWNGPETDEVVWLANERYSWC